MTNNTPKPFAKLMALKLLAVHPGWYFIKINAGTKSEGLPPRHNATDDTAGSTNDPAVIATWPDDCNVGLALARSRVIVIDVDCKPGKVGGDTFDLLELANGPFPPTYTVQSASGGDSRHLYYSATDKVQYRFGKFGPDVDSPHYVLIQGSVVGGGRYERIEPRVGIAQAPDWLADLLEKPKAARREYTGTPVPFPVFKEMLDATPYTEGPPELNDRHGYNGCVDFLMMCHDAACGDTGDYLEAVTQWCLADDATGWRTGETSREWVAEKWASFNEDDPDKPLKTRASWFMLLQSFYGDKYTIEESQAQAADELNEATTDDERTRKEASSPLDEIEQSIRDGRPKVIVRAGQGPRIVRRIKHHLIEDSKRPDCKSSDMLFRRVNDVVHLSRNKLDGKEVTEVDGVRFDDEYHADNDLMVMQAEKYWFKDRAERAIDFVQPGTDDDDKPILVPINAPMGSLATVPAIITTRDFPSLKGTVECPTLREDNSILDEPGYDRKSGLYYDPARATFPKIPDNPTKAEAKKALDLFIGDRGVLRDFPFKDAATDPKDLSKSVALAMILTALVRRVLPTSPMFVMDAFEAQSGKSHLGAIPGLLATGRRTPVRPWPRDEYQRQNTLGQALEAGDPVLLFDNLGTEDELNSDVFCAVLTAPSFGLRRLGSSSGVDKQVVLTNATMIGTGNHVVVGGDMAEGRVLITRVIPEKPLSARTFMYRNLPAHVIANRPALVVAGLTILRAHAVAKDKPKASKSRFPEWGDLVANAIVWLGLPDPSLAEYRSKQTDANVETQNRVVREWYVKFGDKWQELGVVLAHVPIKQLIADARGVADANRLTHKTAFAYLSEMVGVARFGQRLELMRGDGKNIVSRWRLVTIGGDASIVPEAFEPTADEQFAEVADEDTLIRVPDPGETDDEFA
jgi:hypothetical protein